MNKPIVFLALCLCISFRLAAENKALIDEEMYFALSGIWTPKPDLHSLMDTKEKKFSWGTAMITRDLSLAIDLGTDTPFVSKDPVIKVEKLDDRRYKIHEFMEIPNSNLLARIESEDVIYFERVPGETWLSVRLERVYGPKRIPCEAMAAIGGKEATLRLIPTPHGQVVGRAQPGEEARATFRTGEKVVVDGGEDYWYKIAIPAGPSGWVFGAYLELETQEPGGK